LPLSDERDFAMRCMSYLPSFVKKITSSSTDDYTLKSRLKVYLALLGLFIIAVSSFYTYYVVQKLKIEERKKIEQYRNAQELFINTPSWDNLPPTIQSFITNIQEDNSTIPVILTDDHFNVKDARNFFDLDTLANAADSLNAQNKLNALIARGATPIIIHQADNMIYDRIYYDDSKMLTLLKYYPLLQFVLIALFVGFGYLSFSSTRRSEQNRVWVGMAKETAHQLGTPITAISGWIQHLRSSETLTPENHEVVDELDNDVARLTLIADRFSKIGSDPELVVENIYHSVERVRIYMQRRASRRVVFNFPTAKDKNPDFNVRINLQLFDWVLENLIRNALDAMETGEGTIGAHVYSETNFICIDLSDTGKGIPRDKWQMVFKPGYTTKKRGWGLGLSLAKRIIESYHSGKIFVSKSVINKGTIFTIKLPSITSSTTSKV